MKKILLSVIAITLLLSFNSCAPEDPAKGVDAEHVFPKASLSGIAYLNINTATNTPDGTVNTFVPEGTVLSFTIPYSALGISGSPGNYVLTTTVKANGNYEISLPARADGKPVTVTITAQTIAIDINTATSIAGSIKETALYGINPAETVEIISGLVFQKKLNFSKIESFGEEADWVDATYTATLVYNNGKSDVSVPEKTPVKLVIAGNKFVPARSNDLVYITSVGANGALTVKLPAPLLALAPSGLSFNLTSAFVANYFNLTNGVEVASSHNYTLDKTAALYGGETVNAGTIRYIRESLVQAGKIAWKSAKYTVKLCYRKDLTPPVVETVLPGDAKVTVRTTNRKALDPDLQEIIQVYTAAQLIDGITFSAPDPAVSNTPLSFQVEVDFIADIITNAAGDKVKYKFSGAVDNNTIWGEIDKKGGNAENIIDVMSVGAPF